MGKVIYRQRDCQMGKVIPARLADHGLRQPSNFPAQARVEWGEMGMTMAMAMAMELASALALALALALASGFGGLVIW